MLTILLEGESSVQPSSALEIIDIGEVFWVPVSQVTMQTAHWARLSRQLVVGQGLHLELHLGRRLAPDGRQLTHNLPRVRRLRMSIITPSFLEIEII